MIEGHSTPRSPAPTQNDPGSKGDANMHSTLTTAPASPTERWHCEAPGCSSTAQAAYGAGWRTFSDAAGSARVCSAACLPAALAVRTPLIPALLG